ncbi:hypothetical protein CRG98_005691 [Punica granatum]|uniref:Uncharacterized protein n=1 Tax=Punica granatum TaxID=22663 RepID=A0A2I0KZM2_PUNGR|nr:hypothetical protein CRG98_005691 [Punica granatum]
MILSAPNLATTLSESISTMTLSVFVPAIELLEAPLNGHRGKIELNTTIASDYVGKSSTMSLREAKVFSLGGEEKSLTIKASKRVTLELVRYVKGWIELMLSCEGIERQKIRVGCSSVQRWIDVELVR